MKQLVFLLFFLIFYSSSSVLALRVSAFDFQEFTKYLFNVASNSGFRYGDYIYSVSGANSELVPMSQRFRVDQPFVDPVNTNKPPSNLIWQASAYTDSHLYILAGSKEPTLKPTNSVLRSSFASGGALSSWVADKSLPINSMLGSAIHSNGVIYFGGGYQETWDNLTTAYYYSKINTDGSLGDWVQTESLPLASAGGTLITKNGYLYYIGKQDSEHTFRSKIKDDGSLEPWVYDSPLPTQVFRPSVVLVDDAIYVIGGISQGSNVPQDKIYKSIIAENGNLSAWVHVGSFPRPHCCSPAIEHLGKIFVLGGHDGTNYYSEVLVSEKIDDIPISPTPSPLPSPTPTSTPIPPSKTVLITGLGASWNSDAILGCKKTGYSGIWSAAPFSEKIYDPIINAFHASGNYIYPFYYDYRQDVERSAEDLAKFIANLTVPNEQVNLVGHSLGGLVGRSYVENLYSFKVKKFITVGSPNAGLARAYGAWAGGEIWSDNTIFRIAQSSLLRYCTGIFKSTKDTVRTMLPVIQNLLPTYDYLRTWNKDMLIPVSEMTSKNNFLPQSFLSVIFSPDFMTLSGTGKHTVDEIVVRDRTVIDKMRNLWEDGKPFRNINSKEGDDSVLVSSSRIEGQKDVTINESHWGVISSQRGVNEIMKFLELTPVSIKSTNEPTNGFLITSENGTLSDGKKVLWIDGSSAKNISFVPGKGKSEVEVAYFDHQGTEFWKKSDFTGKTLVNFDLLFNEKLKRIDWKNR